MKKYSQYLFLLLIVSCAGVDPKTPSKTYSEDTNHAFEMIERGGSYYLKKAPVSAAPPQIAPEKKIQPKKREEIVIDEKINYQAKPLTREVRSSSKVNERLIEINQNLAFYCMKHRKAPAYGGNEGKCMTFVDKVMSNCQKQHRIANSKLLNCIQTKLKNSK